MFHLSRASIEGKFDEVIERVCWANRWTEFEVNLFFSYTNEKFGTRNTLLWELDLSILTPMSVALKGGKKGVQIEQDGTIRYESHFASVRTRLLCVPFGYPREEPNPTLPAPDYSLFDKDV